MPQDLENKRKKKGGVLGWLKGIKPLAWLIIIGDGVHNFADGLALGAAISQSLTLGVSTTIALILHELPHEIGEYNIGTPLIRTPMKESVLVGCPHFRGFLEERKKCLFM